MKRRMILGIAGVAGLFGLVTLALLLLVPGWASAAPNEAGPVSITMEFDWIRQGRVGLVRVSGADIAEVRAVFQERVFHFYPDTLGWMGMISADMQADTGTYPMQVWIKHTDGQTELIDQTIEINTGEFGRSDIMLPASLIPLLDPAVEESEMNRLFNIFDRFTPERYWQGKGFVVPSNEPEIGWFGTYRLYNETYWRRHTGIDVRMAFGTPVTAMGDGRVILAEELPIRGGYVLIDHGWGVYSGYAHLSQKLVLPGQWVRQGDVIGLSGKNGRSAGAHLHYEMTVGGTWTEPGDFMKLGIGLDQP